MSNPNKKLGLNLGGDEIYLSELSFEKNKYTLTSLNKLNVEPVTSFSQINNESYQKELRKILSDLLKLNKIDTTDIGVSIDYKMGLLKKINYDNKLKDRELEEHFKWELAQYIDEEPEDYVFDIEKIDSASKNPSIILGASPKIITEFINRILPDSLDLRLVDFNIFSASNTMEVNYEFSSFEMTSLVKIGTDKIVVLFNTGNNFKGIITKLYRNVDPDDHEKFAADTTKLLQKGFEKYNTNKDRKGIDRIFLYPGSEYRKLDKILELLSNEEFINLNFSKDLDESKKQKISVLNPFEKIEVLHELTEKMGGDLSNPAYSESIGLAIKLIQKNI